MKIRVLPYGPLIEVIGAGPQEFDLTATTAAEALTELHQLFPELSRWKNRIACAQGDRVLAADDALQADLELALIPPVSGG